MANSVEANRQVRLLTRRIVAGLLVVFVGLATLTAGLGLYLRESLRDTEQFVETFGSLPQDDDFAEEVGGWTAEQIIEALDIEAALREALPSQISFLAIPVSGAMESVISDAVTAVIQSETFVNLWERVLRAAHATFVAIISGDSDVFELHGGVLVLDLAPLITRSITRLVDTLAEVGLELDLPEGFEDFTSEELAAYLEELSGRPVPADLAVLPLVEAEGLEAAKRAAEMADGIIWVALLVLVLATLGALVVSPVRRSTAAEVPAAFGLGVAVLGLTVRAVDTAVAESISPVTSSEVVAEALSGLIHGADVVIVVLVIGALSIGVLAFMGGDHPRAVAVRRTLHVPEWARVPAPRRHADSWIVRNRGMMQLAGMALFTVVLTLVPQLDFRQLVTWLGILGVYLVVLAVIPPWQSTPRAVDADEVASEPLSSG